MATYDNNCHRWSTGLDPIPVDLDTVDAGEIVAGILDQLEDGDGTPQELEQACRDAAMLLGHPDIAADLLRAAWGVIAAEHCAAVARGDA